MGCSPSHSGIIQSIAKNAAKPLKRNKAILPPDQNGITIPLVGIQNSSSEETGGKLGSETSKEGDESDPYACHQEKGSTGGHRCAAERVSLPDGQEEAQGSADESMVNLRYQKGERPCMRKHSSTGSELELASDVQRGTSIRRSRKSKRSNKQGRRSKAKEKPILLSETEKKVDFPEPLVKAHQSAYSYLSPNISKYEAVISMANQATQTQLIMQQMTSFMVMRFDEIIQCLKEITDDGEKLLKDVGNDLIWPLGKGNPDDQPDLLQQLLQYTVNRMQTLNSTVASLTSNALQETCSYLQSAAASMQEKLKVKQMCDERLSRMIKLLEDSAAGSVQSHPNDLTLYSEDSGIGGDNESLKECRSPDKQERRTSQDSSGNQGVNQSQQEAANKNIKGITGQTILRNHRVGKQSSMATSLSMNSLDSSTTLEQDSNNDQESEDSTISDDSDDGEGDNASISSQVNLHQRPMTSPAGAGSFKHSPKWLENPENEEMTLKMKEAISEKIKFVPEKSNSNVWIREEEVLARPSTADGSNRRTSRHRRTRSAESLRSQTEDPTLIELQRTQKELDKKLQLLYKTGKSTTKEKLQNFDVKSFSHAKCIVSGNNTSTGKLKSCLDKSFNILPSQERLTLVGYEKSAEKNLPLRAKTTGMGASVQPEREKTEEKITFVERNLDNVNVSPQKSVRKLIETFSPADNLPKILSVNCLGPLRCVRKFGVPVLPPTIPACRTLEPLDHKCHMSSRDDRDCGSTCKLVTNFTCKVWDETVRHDTNETGMEDLENLPPPPPEILMDDSFNVLQTKEPEEDTQKSTLEFVSSDSPCILKKMGAFQKMRASVKVKDLLPSKNGASMEKAFKSQEDKIVLRTNRTESGQQLVAHREQERVFEMQRKHEIEQAAHLYKQSHKIIPLQNPGEMGKSSNDEENKEVSSDVQRLYQQKQSFPTHKGSEKSPTSNRKASPTRVAVSSASSEKIPNSPPTHRAIIKTHYNVQSSPPPVQRNPNPVNSPKVPSPPAQRKLPSPPFQRKIQSPPHIRRQGSPPSQHRQTSPQSQQKPASPPSQHRQTSPHSQQKPASPPSQQKPASPPSQHRQTSPQGLQKPASQPSQRRLPSPPSQQRLQSPPNGHRLPSPPSQPTPPSLRRLPTPPSTQLGPTTSSHYATSPPVSPSHKDLRRNSDEPLPSSKIFGNAQSIFCPSSTSLFEAKVLSPPNISGTDVASTPSSAPQLRHSFSGRHRVATSAANPQPFVRRCYSDRRPRVQLRLPAPISPTSPSKSSPQNPE
ncbi:photoreceptor cilium actin regulator [Spea bombifrons]|uniref:photoreceptor cilium actin regulator n=1 Tax=Spea bombifrons TaxID=233779 RepID=UPI002348F646|nr:photoreceptor cilium actin regulator [Spea bombifrons]